MGGLCRWTGQEGEQAMGWRGGERAEQSHAFDFLGTQAWEKGPLGERRHRIVYPVLVSVGEIMKTGFWAKAPVTFLPLVPLHPTSSHALCDASPGSALFASMAT